MTAKQQFEQDLEQAVSKGKITTRQFHQKKVIQAQSNRSGVDDGSTQVPGTSMFNAFSQDSTFALYCF